ncbi:MAG TPA: trimeric intracellular cation channel family protein [Deltaproteobacteria bacterium]|nr:trimeric intracellular cation channel family protein [Deltaproteobacteria bacterium]HQB38804.1 trimeric intracellular cation channel family protein [Deltaproteobacteria bacterium]
MNILYTLDLIGTAAFAASGALAGIRREMDIFGVTVLGLVTAIGGGTLRDVLLGDTPPFIFKDETYLYLSIAVSLLVFVFHKHLHAIDTPLTIFDAVGLGTFVVIGTGKALAFQTGFIGSVMAGVMTATAGGMIRDVLSGRVPMVLQKEVYASACLIGAILMTLLHRVQVSDNWALTIPAITVIVLRLLAVRHNWSLPRANVNN